MKNSRGAALITGVTSGIGLELARLFARRKHPLILVAQHADKLEVLQHDLQQRHQIKVQLVACDLSEVQAPQALFDATEHSHPAKPRFHPTRALIATRAPGQNRAPRAGNKTIRTFKVLAGK